MLATAALNLSLSTDPQFRAGLKARVAPRIDVRGPDECWPWRASVLRDGAPRIRLDGVADVTARRAWWLLHHDTIPLGARIVLGASCTTNRCMNVTHFVVDTSQVRGGRSRAMCVGDWMQQRLRREAARPARGHVAPPVRLSPAQFLELERQRRDGATWAELGRLIGLSPAAAYQKVYRYRRQQRAREAA